MARRRSKIPTPSWEHEQGQFTRRLDTSAWRLWATAGVVLLILAGLGLIAFGFLSDYIGDQRRPGSLGLRVGEEEYSVSYFTDRTELYVEEFGNAQAVIVLPTVASALIEESLLLQFASERDVTATDEEIRAEVGRNLSLALDDPNFDARVQEAIARSGLSEDEYYDIARAAVLRLNVIDSFEADVADELPAIHYRQIQVEDQATADGLIEELDGGADFVKLAQEHSLDEATKPLGGDKGWVPEGLVTDEGLEDLIFSLEVGEISTYPTGSGIFILEVVEKSDGREVTDEQKGSLAQAAYSDWALEKREAVDITNEFDLSVGDAKKIGYVIDHAGLTLG